jgi:hypothetical protein
MDDAERRQSLATERDIDPEFGMFTEDIAGYSVPDAEHKLTAMVPDDEAITSAEEDGSFPDIPDADAVSEESPVDPASPPEQFHGTDLLNGVGAHPEEETDDALL